MFVLLSRLPLAFGGSSEQDVEVRLRLAEAVGKSHDDEDEDEDIQVEYTVFAKIKVACMLQHGLVW